MRLFSEKVSPTFNSSGYNILTVKDFSEVFFDVYEFEINGSKFVAEKTGVLDDAPIVSIPVTYQESVSQYDFVLHKGEQSIHFDPNTKSTPTSLPVHSDTEIVLSENVISEEQDEVFLEEKRNLIIEEINKAKIAAAQYLSNLDKQNKRSLATYQTEREIALKEDIDKQKQILFDEFQSFITNLRNDLLESDTSNKEVLGQIIISELNEASKHLDTQLESIENAIESKLEERAMVLLNDVLLTEIERSSKSISENLDNRVASIEQSLNNSLVETKNEIASNITEKLQEITTELNAKDSSIVELNNTLNKQSNKALSRIGTVKTQLEESLSSAVSLLESRIDSASEKLEEYYTNKISVVEEAMASMSEETRQHVIDLIKESKSSLLEEINNIKITVPNIVIEKSNGNQEIDVPALKTELEKSVSNRFVNEISSLKRLIELSSGGGSVAMQFANGGTMNGNLTVVGAISASQYLGISIPSSDYLPLSGGIVTGNVSVTGQLSAERIFTTQLDALSANITVIDIKQYELSGFNVTGNVTINGTVSAGNLSAGDIYSNGNRVATVVDPVRTTLTGDGVLSSFAIAGAGSLTNPSALIVAIDGALQEPSVDYTVSGGNITFTDPLANGAKAVVIAPTNSLQVGILTPSDGSVTSSKLTPDLTLTNPTFVGTVNGSSAMGNFLLNPTSENLAAVVIDETGTEGLVFRNSPNFAGYPTINSNHIQQTVLKDGVVPFTQIFEDFPHGNNSSGSFSIGTHGWAAVRTTGGSNGQFIPSSSAAIHLAWGLQFLTTAATLNAISTFQLGNYNGPSTSPYNTAFQVCFAVAQTSLCQFYLNFGGGGTDVFVRLNFNTGVLTLTRPSVSLTLASDLSLESGNFVTGTKYRLHVKPISTTRTEVWLASAPASSSTWTTLYDQIVTHATSNLGWNCSTPTFGISTQEAVAKTAYVDWASIVKLQAR